jgi:hypothetical protein
VKISETAIQEGARAEWTMERRLSIPWMWMPVWWRRRRRRIFEARMRNSLRIMEQAMANLTREDVF